MAHGLLTAALVEAEVEAPQWKHIALFTQWCDNHKWHYRLEGKDKMFDNTKRTYTFVVSQEGMYISDDGDTAPMAVFNTMRKLHERVRPS
jgi:hypothetical protein